MQSDERSACVLSGDERLALAREAFREYYLRCFWYLRPDLDICDEHGLQTVVRGLRLHGGRKGWLLAARLCPSPTSR